MKVEKTNNKIKRKFIPLLLSLVIPGLGQFVKKEWKKGLLIVASPFGIYFFIIFSMFIFNEIFHDPILVVLFAGQAYVAFGLIYILQAIDAYSN